MNKIKILVPDLPESVADATIIQWNKQEGDFIKQDEILLEIETDKVILEVPAEKTGILKSILEKNGSIVHSKQILGYIEPQEKISIYQKKEEIKEEKQKKIKKNKNENERTLTPGMRRLISKYDSMNIEYKKENNISQNTEETKINNKNKKINEHFQKNKINNQKDNLIKNAERLEKRVPMTRLRKRIAERLLESKNNTSMLTTFNEVNMKSIISIRKKYGEEFEKKYNIKLGFMSFFVKAVLEGLKNFPEINAFIDGNDIVYHNYYDISIAVSIERGLVTPVLRNVEKLNIIEIEKKIKYLASKGKENKLTVEELKGGNFTITNGGIFGSLISTPIINPPQTAILAMHAIKDRVMVVNGKIEILPMMYLALSYDHCLIDGRESVGFLLMIKKILENPIRLLLNI